MRTNFILYLGCTQKKSGIEHISLVGPLPGPGRKYRQFLLTSSQGDKSEDLKGYKLFVGLAATLLSLGVCLYVTLGHDFRPSHFVHGELHVQTIGHALMSSGKYGYVLPFEVISILLLACIVGGILIARKR